MTTKPFVVLDRSADVSAQRRVIALLIAVGLGGALGCSQAPAPQRVSPRPAGAPASSSAADPSAAASATAKSTPPVEKQAPAPATTPPAPTAAAPVAPPAQPPAPGFTPSGEPLGLASPKLDGGMAPGAAAANPIGRDDAQAVLDAALSRAKHDAPAAKPADKPVRSDDVVVIDPGDSTAKEPKNLVEAAKAERARRANTGQAKIVINDKNLHQYAKKGQITVAAPPKTATPAAAAAATANPAHDEQYWRHGALEIRRRWRSAYDRAKELEKSAADWRIRFYAQDDPYVRDGQIKPSWDRALEMLKEAQNEVDTSKKELGDFLDLGRREGALPGWLREGIEEEPPPPPKPVKPGDAIEPPILKDPGA